MPTGNDPGEKSWITTRRFIINILISVVVPLGSGYFVVMTSVEQVFLGLFIFLVGLGIQAASSLEVLLSRERKREEILLIESAADTLLNNIKVECRRLSQRNSRLYRNYVERELSSLFTMVKEANSSGELVVDQNSDTTSLMLKDFSGREVDEIRAIHFLEDNEFLYSVHASHFFSDVAKLVKARKIRKVRRIMVCKDAGELQLDSTRKLISFHHNTQGFEYRILNSDDFQRIKTDFSIPNDTKDFAVYGDDFAYRSMTASSDAVNGIFVSGAEKLMPYVRAFDRAWTSERAYLHKDQKKEKLSLSDLFGTDPVSPNRP